MIRYVCAHMCSDSTLSARDEALIFPNFGICGPKLIFLLKYWSEVRSVVEHCKRL